MKLIRNCKLFLLFAILNSCAVQVPPEGGPKDPDPPKLLSADPPNHSTGFNKSEIRLHFDEYVALNEISNQLIISPPLKYSPEIRTRKKSVIIELRDTLLENTTYTMNFGLGIADNNEGNKLENFQYVFSTGQIIDSLRISGRIVNAFDTKPEKGVLALLYRNPADSLPFKERPFYFARTNDSGFYQVKNISPGEYIINALKDSDGDYLYSAGTEMIGFADTLVRANSAGVDLQIFQEKNRFQLLKAYTEFSGKILFAFSGRADTLKWIWLSDTTSLKIYATDFSKEKDTVTVWYKNTTADSISVAFNYRGINDTTTMRLFNKPDLKNKKKFNVSASARFRNVHPYFEPFYLLMNIPLAEHDFSKIIVREDTNLVNANFSFIDSIRMNMKTDFNWKPGKKYSIFIPPGTLTDIYGNKNDTTQLDFFTTVETDYGTAKLNIKKNSEVQYIVQITDNEGIVYREFIVNNDTTIEVSYLTPRLYRIKLISDRNKNGKWDTGNYLDRVQPEKVQFYGDAITIRANWDVEVVVGLP